MGYGRGSQRELLYIAEDVVGTTPLTPAMKVLRNTGDTITLTRDSFTSNELRADRAVTDLTLGNKQTGGGIDFEWSVENFDDFLAAVLYDDNYVVATGGIPTGDSIENGVTERSFSIEKSFDTSTLSLFELYTGVHVNTLTFNIAANSQITASMDLLGTGYVANSSTAAASEVPAISGGLFDSYNLVIREGGIPIGVGLSLTLNINNNLNPAFALGSDVAQEVIDGRCAVDGTLQIYFEDETIYEKFANDTESSLEIDLISVKGAVTTTYTIKLPRIKYTTADDPVSDEGAVNVSMAFTALQDDILGYTINIGKVVV